MIAVGSSVIIEGTVTGDLLAGGQSVAIEGTVEDDARIAGYTLSLEGEVGMTSSPPAIAFRVEATLSLAAMCSMRVTKRCWPG